MSVLAKLNEQANAVVSSLRAVFVVQGPALVRSFERENRESKEGKVEGCWTKCGLAQQGVTGV